MDKKVIVMNGPPGSGKDTAANHVYRYCINQLAFANVKQHKMADPLKKAVHALFNLAYSPEHYDNFRDEKEAVHPLLLGRSPRQAYIDFSEIAIKPWLGNDIFGVIAANTIHNAINIKLHVFSDGGFVEEWKPIVDYLGPKNVRVVELHVSGKDFGSDSRSYIGDDLKAMYPDIVVTRITNNITKDPLDKQLFLMLVEGVVQQVTGLKPC